MSAAKHRPPTSAEIDYRLRIVSELRDLCLSLGRARKIEEPLDAVPSANPPEPTPDVAPEVSFR